MLYDAIQWALFEERAGMCEWDEYSAILEKSHRSEEIVSRSLAQCVAARCFSASDRIYFSFLFFVFIHSIYAKSRTNFISI